MQWDGGFQVSSPKSGFFCQKTVRKSKPIIGIEREIINAHWKLTIIIFSGIFQSKTEFDRGPVFDQIRCLHENISKTVKKSQKLIADLNSLENFTLENLTEPIVNLSPSRRKK